MVAAHYGHKDVVALLIESGANKEASHPEGDTPLMFAAAKGDKDVAALLIESGANMEASNAEGFTPLMNAARWNKKDVAALLILKGAKVTENVLRIAKEYGSPEMVNLLIEGGAFERKRKSRKLEIEKALGKPHRRTRADRTKESFIPKENLLLKELREIVHAYDGDRELPKGF